MDLTAIQAAIASLKTAISISKNIHEIRSTAEIQSKVIALQSALLEAQNSALSATTAQFELQEKVTELEAKLKAVGDWEEQKKRYALVNPWKGPAQTYALKRSCAEGEEPHFLCANCFHNAKRVILNPSKRDAWILMACPSCKATLDTGYRGIGSPKFAESYVKEG